MKNKWYWRFSALSASVTPSLSSSCFTCSQNAKKSSKDFRSIFTRFLYTSIHFDAASKSITFFLSEKKCFVIHHSFACCASRTIAIFDSFCQKCLFMCQDTCCNFFSQMLHEKLLFLSYGGKASYSDTLAHMSD